MKLLSKSLICTAAQDRSHFFLLKIKRSVLSILASNATYIALPASGRSQRRPYSGARPADEQRAHIQAWAYEHGDGSLHNMNRC